MTRRQPSLSEAKRLIEWGRLGRYWIEFKPKMRGWDWWCYEAEPIASDITRRCFDCGCVLRDKRDAIGFCNKNADIRGVAIQGRWDVNYSIDVCLGCHNRRRPRFRALSEWNERRLFINRVEREIREHRKNNIATS